MVRASLPMVVIGLALVAVAIVGFTRIPGGFLPLEDQGYVLVGAQLPDGAALGRTQAMMDQIQTLARKVPGVDQVVSISGVSVLDNNATLANAGVAYVILKDWSVRGKGQDLRSIYVNLTKTLKAVDAATFVLVPPAIQGIGNSGGFSMMIELRDGSFDFGKLQGVTRTVIARGQTQSGIARLATSFRANVPQLDLTVDRVKAEALHVDVGAVFQTLATYLGSSFVDQFTKFGRTFQVYAQANSRFRLSPADIERLSVRNRDGQMIPLGTLVHITPAVGPSLISLYNLYPASQIIGGPAPGFSSGQAMSIMEQVAQQTLPRGMGYEWTAMSYQEKAVGNQILYAFGLALLLVYLVLAGQYESWLAPVSVILAVPLALLGPVSVLTGLGLDNNLYTQIGLMLLIALAAKNAILIVEVARHARANEGKPIIEAAVEGARTRFRPILMTSFAFILGVMPLVFATGAGANARISIGITVASGMLASTCFAVLLVPSFFVVVQRFEEWRAPRGRVPAIELVAHSEGQT